MDVLQHWGISRDSTEHKADTHPHTYTPRKNNPNKRWINHSESAGQ